MHMYFTYHSTADIDRAAKSKSTYSGLDVLQTMHPPAVATRAGSARINAIYGYEEIPVKAGQFIPSWMERRVMPEDRQALGFRKIILLTTHRKAIDGHTKNLGFKIDGWRLA